MAVSCSCLQASIVSRFSHSATTFQTLRFSRNQISCSSSPRMEPLHAEPQSKFIEFPYVCTPQRELMVELMSSIETRLGSDLHPCTLPPDVQYYENPNGSAYGSLNVRSGIPSSLINLILGSWIHCKLPSGGAVNITTLSAYLRPSTNAPNFVIEFIRTSPVSLVLILDLPPRKDLVLHPEYLKVFYEDTQLDRHRKLLQELPEVRPYFSSSLFVRALFSPSSIMVSIEANDNGEERIDDIIRDHISPMAKEMLGTWFDVCACVEREVGRDESAELERRDRIIKNKTIEIDLGLSYPRLFGQEVADRVLGELRDILDA
ncbi:unnamed protein product [Cuscuta epithymum]|uniref:Red chlorophyll catabolite reductase n=2 Tax=Cuscuta epithymum TaxID=186058 RepID=A0AAV0EPS2_9ASTE|nr:unnamed protein product [Cuscuta epithymum]CAH9124625.1 unnamed protein product [Cuscuta epithymum]